MSFLASTRIVFLISVAFIFNGLSALDIHGHWSLIEEQTKKSDWVKALPLVEKAIIEHEADENLRVTELWILRNLNKHREAIARGKAALTQFENSEKIKEQVSYALCALFDEQYKAANFIKDKVPPEAHILAQEAHAMKPMAWSITVLANSYRIQNQFEKAITLLEPAVKKFPNEKFVRENLAYIYFDAADTALHFTKNYAKAIQLANKGLTLMPDQDWGVRIIAYAGVHVNKHTESIAALLKLHKAKPDDAALRDSIGYVYSEYVKFLMKKKNARELRKIRDQMLPLADAPAERSKPFMWGLMMTTEFLEDFSSLMPFAKKLTEKYAQEPYFFSTYGQLLNRQKLKFEREKNPAYKKIHEESLSYLRKGMDLFEKNNPHRPKLSGLTFPLKGKVMVVAPFDGGGTHSGFEKYSYDFMHVDENGSVLKPGTNGSKNNHYHTFGQTVYSVLDGEVIEVEDAYVDHPDAGYVRFGMGNTIQIRHHDQIISFYVHLKHKSALVKKGQKVKKGDPIAKVGNTGLSGAPHLHFAVVTNDWVTTFFSFEPQKKKYKNNIEVTAEPYEKEAIILTE